MKFRDDLRFEILERLPYTVLQPFLKDIHPVLEATDAACLGSVESLVDYREFPVKGLLLAFVHSHPSISEPRLPKPENNSFQFSQLLIQMPERGFQLLAAARVSGAVEVFEDPRSRQLKTVPFSLQTELFFSQPRLPRSGPLRGGFLHLRLDVLAFPTAGHTSILRPLGASRPGVGDIEVEVKPPHGSPNNPRSAR
jgi:hypothetical protein